MPDPKDTLKNLASSKDQLAQISQMAEGIKSGALPAADAFKIPDQVAAAQGMLDDLEGTAHLDAAKGALDDATKAAGGLKDELAKKLPAPVSAGKDALTGLGKEVAASGDPIKAVTASLPAVKLPIGDAASGLGDLQKKVSSAETLQKSIPDIQSKLTSLQEQIPKVASQLDPPKEAIQGLTGKLTDVLGGVKPLLDKPPLAQSLQKAGTGDLVKQHLAAAEEKLPKVPPLLDQAKAKISEAVAPLLEAGKKLAELQAAAMAAIPPMPNVSLDNLQQQLNDTAASLMQAAAPVDAAAANLPAAQQQVTQAQALAASASDQMKPPEIKQAMDQVAQLIGDAQKQVVAPAAGMPGSAETLGPIQNELSAIKDAATVVLPGAAAAAPAEQQTKAAELFGHAQDALNPAPAKIAEAAPAVQQLAEKLPELSAPLAQALQTMNDALTPEQQDLAELERLLLQAQDQLTVQTQQADDASKQLNDSQKKVDTALGVNDTAQLRKMLDDITAGLPQLDDKTISDLEKKVPDLEALLDRIEKSGGAA